MQTAVGLVCVLLGMVHFVDRGRPIESVRHFYLGTPRTSAGRGSLAVAEVVVGFVLLFTA